MGETDDSTTTMELSLRFDGEGRTTYDPALRSQPSKRARMETPPTESEDTSTSSLLDYASKTASTTLSSLDPALEKAMDDLLFDCEITDCGLLPRTFWVPATSSAPRTFCERLALEVFRHHVPSNNGGGDFYYDPETSGAEWWVQLRPSPPGTGRYSMLAADVDDNDMAKSGISFHWDKDEDLRLMCGGTMYIHPHLSTVTYLTDLGAPTVVLSKRVDPMTGLYRQEESSEMVEGLVSWPRKGKHLSFDGRYLHAAPSDLMEEGVFEEQCKFDAAEDMDEKDKKVLARRHRRVTFLVNIWLNHRPFNVNPFPETMIGKLSKTDLFGDQFALFGDKEGGDGDGDKPAGTKTVVIRNGKATIAGEAVSVDGNSNNPESSSEDVKLTKKSWSMGQKEEETIEVLLLVELIREQGKKGLDVAMTWHDGVVLGGTGA